MWIEQAIFARTASGHANRYDLNGQTTGVTNADAAALAAWGPAHDCLLDYEVGASSINFFPLPSGAYCISRSISHTAGLWQEATEVVTHCLVISSDALHEVHGNPFAIVQSVTDAKMWLTSAAPRRLEPIQVRVEAPMVDEVAISRAISVFGLGWLIGTMDNLLQHSALALAGGSSRVQLVAAIMSCLPPACRSELSFSTGLKYSPRRPFRLFAVGVDPAEKQRLSRQGDVVMLDLRDEAPATRDSSSGWSGWMAETIGRGDSTAFVERMCELPRGLRMARLDTWGDLLLQQTFGDGSALTGKSSSAGRFTRADGPKKSRTGRTSSGDIAAATGGIAALEEVSADPAVLLGRDCPGAVEVLETFDDAVFETICGKPGALETMQALWPDLLRRVGPDWVEEARAQYVRHVMSLWQHCVDGDELRNPSVSITVTELIDFLLGGR